MGGNIFLKTCRADFCKQILFVKRLQRAGSQVQRAVLYIQQKRIHAKWGKPDGHLSGFWGEIWFLNEEKDGRITLYYDEDGKVDDVVVDAAPGKTTEK